LAGNDKDSNKDNDIKVEDMTFVDYPGDDDQKAATVNFPMRRARSASNTKEQNDEEGWEFSGVLPTYRNEKIVKYNLSISAGIIGELFDKGEGKIVYDPEFQRGEKVLKSGKIVPIFKMSKVKEILQGMQENTLHGGTLVLNSIPENNLVYNEEEDTVKGNGTLSIIDGQHRIRSCYLWWKQFAKGKCLTSPYDYEFPVTLESVSRIMSGDIFAEYGIKQMRINRTRAEVLNVRNLSNHIIRSIIDNSKLKGKVDFVSNTYKNDKIVTFGILAEGVNTFFRPQDEEQITGISNYLIEMLNKLMVIFNDQMGNIADQARVDNRKKYLTIEKLCWIAYFALFKELLGKDKVEEKLAKLRNKIKIGKWEGTILEKSCPIWQGSILRQGNRIVSTRTTQAIINKVLIDFVINNKIDGAEPKNINQNHK